MQQTTTTYSRGQYVLAPIGPDGDMIRARVHDYARGYVLVVPADLRMAGGGFYPLPEGRVRPFGDDAATVVRHRSGLVAFDA